MKRFTGADFETTVELINSAQHDRQKFYVDGMLDWRELENGAIEILVRWRGFEKTWKPATEIYKDVPEKVLKFLRENKDQNPPSQALDMQLKAADNKIPKGNGRSKGRTNRGRGRGRGRKQARGRGRRKK